MFDSLKAMAIHEQQKGIPLNADSSACSSNFSCEYCSEGKRLAIPGRDHERFLSKFRRFDLQIEL